MIPSFSLPKDITEKYIYNFGIALPFIVAFYLLNNTQQFVVPVIDYTLGEQISTALTILGVTLQYIMFLLFFLLQAVFLK